MLVPLLHGTNKLVKWVSSFEGVKPFIENVPEHPDINYRNMPVRSMYELRRLIQTLDKVLPQVQIPALIIHADQDPVVAVESAKTIIEELGSENKQLKIVNANHHGILKDNSGDTWAIIDQFLKQLGTPSFNTETSLSSSNNLVKLQDYR
jgi:esterase/lipase